jgi:Cu-Zn family superoxide dismutase
LTRGAADPGYICFFTGISDQEEDAMKLAPFALLAVAAAVLAAPAPVTKAVAALGPLGSSGVSGTVTFTKVEGGVKVAAKVAGLKEGQHGFHVHEFGDCSAADGSSAGGHFNPTAEPHAGPHDAHRHTGDMGNLTAGADGVATVEYVDSRASFYGPNSILGRGVIVHASPDDFKTQPTGNAGGRLACGVIGVAKAQ